MPKTFVLRTYKYDFCMPKENYTTEIDWVHIFWNFQIMFLSLSSDYTWLQRFPLDLYKSDLQILKVLGEPEVQS